MAVIPWKPMMSRINICAVCVTACFKLAGYKLYKCSRQNRHKKRGSMLIADLFALDTETRRTIIDKPPAASWPLPDLSSLTWFFFISFWGPLLDPCLIVMPPCMGEADRFSLEALRHIHKQLDDDNDGGIEVNESVEVSSGNEHLQFWVYGWPSGFACCSRPHDKAHGS